MKKTGFPLMEARDERQFMLQEDFEILEKYGVPVGAVEMHSHSFYELLYIEEGEFATVVDNQLYLLEKGDFLLIDRNCLHHYQFVEKKHDRTKRLLLWVTREFLQLLSDGGADLTACFSAKGAPAWRFPPERSRGLIFWLYRMREAVEDEYGSPAERRMLERSYMTLFFVELNRLCRTNDFRLRTKECGLDPMAQRVYEYIDRHIGEPITVDDLADAMALSKFYFLRKFKDVTGMTVHDVVVKKRLMHACREIESGRTISEAWADCGFADYSSFFRNFKSTYGMSPREFKAGCEGRAAAGAGQPEEKEAEKRAEQI